jgi:arginyl-tRNA synthetase
MVQLYRGGEKAYMSTRKGEFVTLRQLREEVGNDAARFFYVMRRCEQQLDFDLDLARSESSENPVYYLQYAHARICSVMKQAAERGYDISGAVTDIDLGLLNEPQEQSLLRRLAHYPDLIAEAALAREPHQLTFYLRDVANEFHGYYNALQFLVEDEKLRAARLALIRATRRVLANGFGLLGVSAPEEM